MNVYSTTMRITNIVDVQKAAHSFGDISQLLKHFFAEGKGTKCATEAQGRGTCEISHPRCGTSIYWIALFPGVLSSSSWTHGAAHQGRLGKLILSRPIFIFFQSL